jgi:hypothetical protein
MPTLWTCRISLDTVSMQTGYTHPISQGPTCFQSEERGGVEVGDNVGEDIVGDRF